MQLYEVPELHLGPTIVQGAPAVVGVVPDELARIAGVLCLFGLGQLIVTFDPEGKSVSLSQPVAQPHRAPPLRRDRGVVSTRIPTALMLFCCPLDPAQVLGCRVNGKPRRRRGRMAVKTRISGSARLAVMAGTCIALYAGSAHAQSGGWALDRYEPSPAGG